MSKIDNITTWKQGKFIDSHKYSKWTKEDKREAQEEESHLVRPKFLGNAICTCPDPEAAEWIAKRLNFAAEFEQLMKEFIAGELGGKKELIIGYNLLKEQK